MRPPCGCRWEGLTCFQTRLIPSTTMRSRSGMMRRTLPVFPLSAPQMMTTSSPRFTFRAMSHHLAGQGDDLHEILLAQFAGDGSEDARAARIVFLVDDDRGVAVETDVAAVGAAARLLGADDHAADDFTLLDLAAGQRFLDGADDDVADVGDLALELALAAAAAKDLDTHRLLGAGVVGDVNVCLLLDHGVTEPPAPCLS